MWTAAAGHWQAVAEATPDRTKVPPALDTIQNDTLRWMLLSSYRHMADGSYVHLTDLVRFESGS